MKHLERLVPNATVFKDTPETLVIRFLECDSEYFGVAFTKLLAYGRKMRLHNYELFYISLEEALSA